ncbi:peroxiredoxin family protein [Rubinisphaera margarita]|uniref:peroxiredoxin family protein n=1 Tax=Rubinisphaera margarita TaxID=2909586 RepID=UPI001EE8CDBA|nr:redoxin domain-containing protein [Rubinisphaera margarita]MCG6155434.1 peroxiredoxin family protein [Rubinisphaera margarita]
MKRFAIALTGLCLLLAATVDLQAAKKSAAEKAPEWSVESYTGGTLSGEDYDSNVLLIFYRGVTCVHCMEQLSGIARNAEKFEKRNIEIVAISHDLPNRSTVDRIRDRNNIKFSMGTDPRLSTFEDFNCLDGRRQMHGLVLINPKGHIVWKSVTEGAITNVDSILSKIDDALSQKVSAR